MVEEADYVIAGGGSAGCVLANRLSEDSRNRVVLLEAGPTSDIWMSKIPAGMRKIIADPERDWFYTTEPDPSAKNRPILWFSGKMLGGGSAINGMVYIRGTTYDYDQWAADGCVGWSWNDVLPYFLRSEDFEGPDSPMHGKGGPLGVAPLRIIHPLAHAFLRACTEIGLREVDDYCAGDIDGVYFNLATQRRGNRCSTAEGFLKPVLRRPNLRVITGATVDRVLIENGRASGVRYLHQGQVKEVRVKGEVIVSAGTVQSPAILMRSGIGPGSHLREHGVAVAVDAAGVGRNLHEHPSMHNSRLVNLQTYNVTGNIFRLAKAGLDYLLFRRGLLTTCSVHVQAHGRTSPDRKYPDIKLQMCPFWSPPMNATGPVADPTRHSGIGVSVNLMDPKSRGEIRLRSADPTAKPVIDYRLYDVPSDLERMRKGVQFVNRIYEAPAFAKHVVGPGFPLDPKQSDAAWEEHLRMYSMVGFHPVGTCRMGGDAASVVDPHLRVRGVASLRVADASIIPVLPSANTNAPAIMIGERGADFVKAAQRDGGAARVALSKDSYASAPAAAG